MLLGKIKISNFLQLPHQNFSCAVRRKLIEKNLLLILIIEKYLTRIEIRAQLFAYFPRNYVP